MTTSAQDYAPDWTDVRTEASATPLAGSWDRADWQRLWLQTQTREWRTLAIVPGDSAISAYEVANLIMALGLRHGEAIGLADLREVKLHRVSAFLDAANWHVSRGERLVFAMRSVSENLATIPLARAADCAILCASLGATSIDTVQQTIEQIGREHFLGSLLLRGSNDDGPPTRALSLWHKHPKARA